MVTQYLSTQDIEDKFWNEIASEKVVMLGSPDPKDHMQPMTAYVDDAEKRIWFFIKKSSDLFASCGALPQLVDLILKRNTYQASVRGYLSVLMSPEARDIFWNPVVEAWFKHGKNDSDLSMLCFQPVEAEIWESAQNPFKFAWEVMRANLTDQLVDVGDHAVIEFDSIQ